MGTARHGGGEIDLPTYHEDVVLSGRPDGSGFTGNILVATETQGRPIGKAGAGKQQDGSKHGKNAQHFRHLCLTGCRKVANCPDWCVDLSQVPRHRALEAWAQTISARPATR